MSVTYGIRSRYVECSITINPLIDRIRLAGKALRMSSILIMQKKGALPSRPRPQVSGTHRSRSVHIEELLQEFQSSFQSRIEIFTSTQSCTYPQELPMLMPDFEKLYRAAIQTSSFAEVMISLGLISNGESKSYGGDPTVVVKKDSVTIRMGTDIFVLFDECQAIELVIKTMLDLHSAVDDKRFDIFREAATQLWHARRYSLTYEYQKATLAKLSEDPSLVMQARINLDKSIGVNGDSPQTEEWRVLLDYPISEISEIVLSHNQHAHELRRYSPLRSFISAAERGEIYKRVMGRMLTGAPPGSAP